jgi:DNA-binding transcriptional MerR regulator
MAQHQPIRSGISPSQNSSEIPDKLYFRIGEVARLCDVPAYVLRFWESEFPQLKPTKGGTGQRLFRRRDLEIARRIKALLYEEGYTIPGARQIIRSEVRRKESMLPLALDESSTAGAVPLRRLQRELRDLHALLSGPTVRTFQSPARSIAGQKARTSSRKTLPADPLFSPPASDL